MERTFSKKIGLVGVSGPRTVTYAAERIMEICQSEYRASSVYDFPDMVLESFSSEVIDQNRLDQGAVENLSRRLNSSFDVVKSAKASLMYVVGNSLPRYRHLLDMHAIDEVNPVQATTNYLADKRPNAQVSVISSDAERRENYNSAFQAAELKYMALSPSEQSLADGILMDMISGRGLEGKRAKLDHLVGNLLANNDLVVLGAPELSYLVGQQTSIEGGLVDAQEISLRALLREAQ